MPVHQLQPADPDVARTLVSGVTGIHPRKINVWAVLAENSECGAHLTTNLCCAYHALEWAVEVWEAERQRLIPCAVNDH